MDTLQSGSSPILGCDDRCDEETFCRRCPERSFGESEGGDVAGNLVTRQPLTRLFEPIEMGRVRLRNRIVMAGHGSRFVDPHDHTLTRRQAAYLAERARGGVGLIIQGSGIVHPTGLTFGGINQVWDDTCIPAYAQVVDAQVRMKRLTERPNRKLWASGTRASSGGSSALIGALGGGDGVARQGCEHGSAHQIEAALEAGVERPDVAHDQAAPPRDRRVPFDLDSRIRPRVRQQLRCVVLHERRVFGMQTQGQDAGPP